jgi:large subunit ribosomal protein L30
MSARGKAATLRIRMIGSVIGCTEEQRATVRGLGLRRLHQVVEREDTPAVRGMVRKVPHLVALVEGPTAGAGRRA